MISDPHDQNTVSPSFGGETVAQSPEQLVEDSETVNRQDAEQTTQGLGEESTTDHTHSSVVAESLESSVDVEGDAQNIRKEAVEKTTSEGETTDLQDARPDDVIDEGDKNLKAHDKPETTESPTTEEVKSSTQSEEKQPEPTSWQEKLIEEVFTEDEAQYDKDLEELTAHRNEIKNWQERTRNLLKHLDQTNTVCQKLLNNCNEAYQSLPEELQDKLKGRQDGLELIRKMLERLLEQMQAIADKSENLDIPQKLPEPNKEAIAEVVNQQADKDLAPKAIKQKLKTIGNERWQIVSKNREEAKSQQKKWLQFVDRKILGSSRFCVSMV